MHPSRYHKNLHEKVQPGFLCARLTTSSNESTGASGMVKIDVLGTAFQAEVVGKTNNPIFHEVLLFLVSDTSNIFLLQGWGKGLKPPTLPQVKQSSTEHLFTPTWGEGCSTSEWQMAQTNTHHLQAHWNHQHIGEPSMSQPSYESTNKATN